MPRPSFRVRLGLVAIFAVFALGFVVSPGRAQPGRPPGFPPNRPPGFPPAGPPSIPTPPTPPRPPSFPGPGFGGPGVGGIPSPPSFGSPSRSEWVCSNCRHVVGTGPVRPSVTQCPKCSVRFSNPGPGAGAAPGVAPPAPNGEPPASALVAPELPPNPNAGLPGTTSEPTPAAAGEPSVSPTTSAPAGTEATASGREPEAKSGPRTLLIVGIVIAGVFVFGTLAMLAVVVSKANAPQHVRRPKRRVIDLDD